jgi:hypothetical protein
MAVCECVFLSGAVWAALAPLATYLIYAAAVALRRTPLRLGPPAR